jgi:hypothetical protein
MRNMSHEATELVLYIDNTEPFYRRTLACNAALARKVLQRKYDPSRAAAMFRPMADDAAKAYTKEHGAPGDRIFSVACREEVANDYARAFDARIADGCLDDLGDDAAAILRKAVAPPRTCADRAPSVPPEGS